LLHIAFLQLLGDAFDPLMASVASAVVGTAALAWRSAEIAFRARQHNGAAATFRSWAQAIS
jgi:hypothetical protein